MTRAELEALSIDLLMEAVVLLDNSNQPSSDDRYSFIERAGSFLRAHTKEASDAK